MSGGGIQTAIVSSHPLMAFYVKFIWTAEKLLGSGFQVYIQQKVSTKVNCFMRKLSPYLVLLPTMLLPMLSLNLISSPGARAQGFDQSQEKRQLRQMKDEIRGIKGEMQDALDEMDKFVTQAKQSDSGVKEFHLFAKRGSWEITPGVVVDCLTYNGKVPGPLIRVSEGDKVRIVLHNQSDVATSLLLHGLPAPHIVSGLPRREAGLVQPGQSYAYQFIAKHSGTFWYHPQVNHAEQRSQGLAGALVVDAAAKPYDKEFVVVLGDLYARKGAGGGVTRKAVAPDRSSSTNHYYMVNGKAAPAIPPIDVKAGERVRLRVVNAGQEAIPLHLTGHHFEVVTFNGSDPMEPHVFRDTITINPSDHCDLEFTANNPGVWSLASELYEQSTTDGKFPGGIACVLRYENFDPAKQ